MKVKYLCGCTTGDIVSRENLKTMDASKLDEEGFITCALHGARRVGWRSLPTDTVVFNTDDGEELDTDRADYFYAQFSPLEIEGHLIFGDALPENPLSMVGTLAHDTRDLRDPESLVEKVRKSKKYPFGIRSVVAR